MHATPNLRPTRQEVEVMQWGVAAPCTSDRFKTYKVGEVDQKPQARRWDHRLNAESAARAGSSLKTTFKHLQKPDMISLGGGLPLSDYFPIESLAMQPLPLKDPSYSNGQSSPAALGHIIQANKDDITMGRSVYDLSVALNYSQGSGSAQFLRWITEHTEMVHNPPYDDWQCTMSIGNTSALDMVLRMLAKDGDYVLADEYTFATAVETAAPMGVKFLGISMDKQGLVPEKLHETLAGWDEAERGARKPSLLYSIPTGHNPTGATQSIERRQAIYRVAQEHDLIILEDDPYYFLQMESPNEPNERQTAAEIGHAWKPDNYLQRLVPSYLSMDVDGRVIRMDSFSKIICPGLRLGWITATSQIVQRYKRHADVSTQGPSGFSQLALFKLLDEHWGHAGFFQWLENLSMEYTARRDLVIRACEAYLPPGIVSWEPAQAGMFQWLKVNWRHHTHVATRTVEELEEEIWLDAIAHGVLVARGSWFRAGQELQRDSDAIFFRITFAAAPVEKIEEAVQRLGASLYKCFPSSIAK